MNHLQKLLTKHITLWQRIQGSNLPEHIKAESQQLHEQMTNLFGEPADE